eukprot:765131-Hanusia_phi.AAC.3
MPCCCQGCGRRRLPKEGPARDLDLVRGEGREEAAEESVGEAELEEEVKRVAVAGLDPVAVVGARDDSEGLKQHAQRLTLLPLLLLPPLRQLLAVALQLARQVLHEQEDPDDAVGGGGEGGGELQVVTPQARPHHLPPVCGDREVLEDSSSAQRAFVVSSSYELRQTHQHCVGKSL